MPFRKNPTISGERPDALVAPHNQPAIEARKKATQAHDRQRAWHVITCEYPPQIGGVSDYTFGLAAGLSAAGDEVHVWCPDHAGETPGCEQVVVHRALGHITPSDLERVGEQLDCFPAPRRILVQWVPHGYGYRAMNLPFAWWLRNRARHKGDHVEIMLHEPYLSFRLSSLRQSAVALVHRLMTIILLRAAERVWMSIPGWEETWRPYAFGRSIPFTWLPIPSSIPVHDDPAAALALRERYLPNGGFLIGHFGTFGTLITGALEAILLGIVDSPAPADSDGGLKILLLGKGSQDFLASMLSKHPRLASVLCAAGQLQAQELSSHIAACDLMIQPYPDGVSSRRTSFMVGLSHGKPVVATEGGLTEDCWAASGAVRLAPVGNIARFVELVRQVQASPFDRARLGMRAQEFYRERFEMKYMVAALRSAAALTASHSV